MIVIYTFDFKKGTSISEMKFQYIMLVISIQSILDCKKGHDVCIKIYTNDKDVERYITRQFDKSIDIIISGEKSRICDNGWFTCAGHKRIDALTEFHKIDDVLYVDNDTIFHPNFFKHIKSYKHPTLYMKESWNNLALWCYRHHKTASLFNYIEGNYLSNSRYIDALLPVLNNGVIYLPKTRESELWIKGVSGTYNDLVKNCGYSYGLDQTSMAITNHLLNVHSVFCVNEKMNETVYHFCYNKGEYRQKISDSGMEILDNFTTNSDFVMVYNKIFGLTKRI